MTLASVERPKTGIKVHNDQEIIRTALIAELDATSLYQAQIDNLENEEAKRVIKHIMDEEKEHAAELSCILMRIDETQEKKMTEVNGKTCISE